VGYRRISAIRHVSSPRPLGAINKNEENSQTFIDFL